MTFQPRRSTPAGEHRPVMAASVLDVLRPAPGETAVDCTLGFGGHAGALLSRVGPGGRLIGLDLDSEHLDRVRERLAAVHAADGDPRHAFELCHANFAGLDRILHERGLRADCIVADLGMSSMQVDDPERGFSYARDGALDMRMDRKRGRSVAQLVATLDEEELARALVEFGDEPQASLIARAIVAARQARPITRTIELARVIQDATGQAARRLQPRTGTWSLHPAARTFQALRILANRELANLEQLLRVLPACLAPGGRVAIISFHSGEDRLVKSSFRDGLRQGLYQRIADNALRPAFSEKQSNPRSRSAKLRWAVAHV